MSRKAIASITSVALPASPTRPNSTVSSKPSPASSQMAEQGLGTRALVNKLLVREAQEDALRARMATAPSVAPDIHPNIAEISRKKVERLAEAFNQPAERDEAADAIRGLIERLTLFPGIRRGEMSATLYGEFGTILEWVSRREASENNNTPGAFATGVLVSVVAGNRNKLLLAFARAVRMNFPGGQFEVIQGGKSAEVDRDPP